MRPATNTTVEDVIARWKKGNLKKGLEMDLLNQHFGVENLTHRITAAKRDEHKAAKLRELKRKVETFAETLNQYQNTPRSDSVTGMADVKGADSCRLMEPKNQPVGRAYESQLQQTPRPAATSTTISRRTPDGALEQRRSPCLGFMQDILRRLDYDLNRDGFFREFLLASTQFFARQYRRSSLISWEGQREDLLRMSSGFLRGCGNLFWPANAASPWYGKLQYHNADHAERIQILVAQLLCHINLAEQNAKVFSASATISLSHDQDWAQHGHAATLTPYRPPQEQRPQLAKRNKNVPNLSHEDLETLNDGNWLNDEVINFCVADLAKYNEILVPHLPQNVQVLDTFFLERVRQGYIYGDGNGTATARKNLLRCKYSCIPIHDANHWYLVIICNNVALTQYARDKATMLSATSPYPEQNCPAVFVLDSLGQSHPNTCELLSALLIEVGAEAIGTPLSLDVKGIPQQENLDDCGIFTLGYLVCFLADPARSVDDFLSTGPNWSFDASQLRHDIRDGIATRRDATKKRHLLPLLAELQVSMERHAQMKTTVQQAGAKQHMITITLVPEMLDGPGLRPATDTISTPERMPNEALEQLKSPCPTPVATDANTLLECRLDIGQARTPPRQCESTVQYPSNEDLQTLNDGNQISNVIFNFFIDSFRRRLKSQRPLFYQRVHLFDGCSFKRWRDGALFDVEKLPSLRKSLLSADYSFIPIHEADHWYLVILCTSLSKNVAGVPSTPVRHELNLQRPVIFILDSSNKRHPEMHKLLRSMLVNTATGANATEAFQTPCFKDVNVMPQQSSNLDSGIFILDYLTAFLEKPALMIDTFFNSAVHCSNATRIRRMMRDYISAGSAVSNVSPHLHCTEDNMAQVSVASLGTILNERPKSVPFQEVSKDGRFRILRSDGQFYIFWCNQCKKTFGGIRSLVDSGIAHLSSVKHTHLAIGNMMTADERRQKVMRHLAIPVSSCTAREVAKYNEKLVARTRRRRRRAALKT